MAFNMKRPVIKGTQIHKASIAKARSESIVSQGRTKADSSLVGAGQVLGQSYIPSAIDFSIDMPAIDLGEREKSGRDKSGDKKASKIKGKKAKKLEVKDNSGPDLKKRKPPEYTPPREKKQEEVLKVEPKKIKPLPTSKKKVELQRATRTVQTKKSIDKFEVAAKKAGLPITTAAEYERAERLLVYDEGSGNWREKVGTGTPDGVIVGETKNFTGNKGSADDQYKAMQKAGLDYGVGGLDMKSDGKGGYMPKEGAVSTSGDTWDDKLGGWRDDGREQNYGPGGEKISRETADKVSGEQQRRSDKIQERKEKKKALDAKNVKIRERNKKIADAKKFYGKDVKLTQARLDAYNKSVERQEAELNSAPIEIPEQDDPEPWEIAAQEKRDLNSNTPQNAPKSEPKGTEPKSISTRQKRLDKKYQNSGPSVRANMLEDGYTPSKGKSPVEMRDNRIYRNAKEDGPVRRNMIKGGYKPQ